MPINLEVENDSRMCCEAHSAICKLYPEDQIGRKIASLPKVVLC